MKRTVNSVTPSLTTEAQSAVPATRHMRAPASLLVTTRQRSNATKNVHVKTVNIAKSMEEMLSVGLMMRPMKMNVMQDVMGQRWSVEENVHVEQESQV